MKRRIGTLALAVVLAATAIGTAGEARAWPYVDRECAEGYAALFGTDIEGTAYASIGWVWLKIRTNCVRSFGIS